MMMNMKVRGRRVERERQPIRKGLKLIALDYSLRNFARFFLQFFLLQVSWRMYVMNVASMEK